MQKIDFAIEGARRNVQFFHDAPNRHFANKATKDLNVQMWLFVAPRGRTNCKIAFTAFASVFRIAGWGAAIGIVEGLVALYWH